jgi:DNA-3-methyladenine glycosylase I
MQADDNEPRRCRWAEGTTPEMQAYHDDQWGVPLHGEQALFELLSLEGAQAGLSWSTVLGRREGYRRVFARFDVELIAGWPDAIVDELIKDPGIIRNRAKVLSVLNNARAARALGGLGTDLDAYLWSFVGGVPLQPRLDATAALPATTEVSTAMSRDLKKKGFGFVGPTIAYAFMQASGMTNDHTTDCFRHADLAGDAG